MTDPLKLAREALAYALAEFTDEFTQGEKEARKHCRAAIAAIDAHAAQPAAPAPFETVPVPVVVAWSGGPAPYRFVRLRLDDTPKEYEYIPAQQAAPVGAEPDWDDVREQAEMATGLKVERHTYSIVVREVRKWLAARATPPAVQAQVEPPVLSEWKLAMAQRLKPPAVQALTDEQVHHGARAYNLALSSLCGLPAAAAAFRRALSECGAAAQGGEHVG